MKADLGRLRDFIPLDEFDEEGDSAKLPYVDGDLYDRLTQLAVAFARANPQPIPRQLNPRLHR